MTTPRSALARLSTTGRFIASRLLAPGPVDAALPLGAALAGLPRGSARITGLVTLKSGDGWLDTGIDVRPGESVTLLGSGRLWMSKGLGIGCTAKVALWHRIGGGRICKSLDDTTTFAAEGGGRLELVTKPPGEWLDEHGAFEPGESRKGFSGALEVAIVVWEGAGGLAAAAAADPGGPFAVEAQRQATWPELPPGWAPLWRLGASGIYRRETLDGRAAITCRTRGDVGILRHALDLPLRDDTRLAWSWRMHELPSAFPEDLIPTHDYLSLAVEFDNGRDLTYMWSSTLGSGTSFHCPLAWWCNRETHLVVRTRHDRFGAWLDEERAPLADYRAVIGGPDPARVVGVWLISVSVFQQRTGRCDYSRIAISDAERRVAVL